MKKRTAGVRVWAAVLGAALMMGGTDVRAGGLLCPGVCVGGSNHGERCFSVSECPGSGTACQLLERCIYVEWRPQQVVVSPGSVASLELWVYSSDGFTIPLDGSDILLSWDETRLELLGKVDPCLICAGGSNSGNLCQFNSDCPSSSCIAPGLCFEGCPAQTYNWFASVFPNDCNANSLNEPCTGGVPANDGDALYQNFKQIECNGDPGEPAPVTPLGDGSGGLHLTTFRFQPVIAEGGAMVSVPLELGATAKTRFVGGSVPGQNLLGLIGDPAQVIVSDICDPPTVSAVGPRYISITPAAGSQDVALRVRGSSTNSAVSCVSKYVHTSCRGGTNHGQLCDSDAECGGGTCDNGKLVDAVDAQYMTPAEWGTITVSATEIEPNTLYTVRADCGLVPGDLLSNAVSVTTWIWGDTAMNGSVSFADITKTVDAFRGTPGISIEATDLTGSGCNPQYVVNFADITANVDAFRGTPYRTIQCPAPCP